MDGIKRPRRDRSQSAALSKASPRSVSRGRSLSRQSRDESGVRDVSHYEAARKQMKRGQTKFISRGRIGEADRVILSKKPKHLYVGKRGLGKTQRR